MPFARDKDGFEVGAARGVLTSLMGMLKDGVTHIALGTDYLIESFRNRFWPGYKTGDGIEPALLAQFALLEEILIAANAWQGTRIVQLNRRKRVLIDEAGVIGKFGVVPKSIPDYLALVGDSAMATRSSWVGLEIVGSNSFQIPSSGAHSEALA